MVPSVADWQSAAPSSTTDRHYLSYAPSRRNSWHYVTPWSLAVERTAWDIHFMVKQTPQKAADNSLCILHTSSSTDVLTNSSAKRFAQRIELFLQSADNGQYASLDYCVYFNELLLATNRLTSFPFPFIDNGRTRRPLTPIKYMDKTVSTIDSDNTKSIYRKKIKN